MPTVKAPPHTHTKDKQFLNNSPRIFFKRIEIERISKLNT